MNTTPVRTSEPVSVTIHITDGDDSSPQFISPFYAANVSASGPPRPIIEVRAFSQCFEGSVLLPNDFKILKFINSLTLVTNLSSEFTHRRRQNAL